MWRGQAGLPRLTVHCPNAFSKMVTPSVAQVVHKVSQAQGSRSVPSWLLRSCPQVALLDGETLQRFIQRLALQVVMMTA
ncbi:hypothetical protein WJX82_006050 [Trebouxia sp. C0006]